MFITKTDPNTNEEHTVNLLVTASQIKVWRTGSPIDIVMPRLTAAEKDFLTTGTYSSELDSSDAIPEPDKAVPQEEQPEPVVMDIPDLPEVPDPSEYN